MTDLAMITRREDWEVRLFAEIQARQHLVFDFKKHDCCRSGAALVKAMTDHDLMKGLRGYRSAAGAVRMISENGGDLFDIVKRRCAQAGWKQIPVSQARRGDIVFTRTPPMDTIDAAIGVVVGHKATFPGGRGWEQLGLGEVSAAFNVPFPLA